MLGTINSSERLRMIDTEPCYLFTVQAVFDIQSRGLVIVTDVEIGQAEVQNRLLAMGQTIELRRPDGKVCLATIKGYERFSPYDPKRPLAYSVGGDLTKNDIPVGTEAWEPGGYIQS